MVIDCWTAMNIVKYNWIQQYHAVSSRDHYMNEDDFSALFGLNFEACNAVAALSFVIGSPITSMLMFLVGLYHLRVYPMSRVGAQFWNLSRATYRSYIKICVNWWVAELPRVSISIKIE